MRASDIIARKRDGYELTTEQIDFMIQGYVRDSIPDYQMAALLMAIYIRGMSVQETVDLTMSMVQSGDQLDLSSLPGPKIDKHSTGGVGDKTTLVVAPIVAAAGVPVAKMSGRGLGHSGGTIDKLESIPGFQTALEPGQFADQVRRIGLALSGQTGNLAPADKKVYALRDVTATVASLPLIASSIMSKKIAAGADAIVLDVKWGSGAFMPDVDSAVDLARIMVDIGRGAALHTVAVISNMDQPLGWAVGNALEVKEAIGVLQGQGPADVADLSAELAARMLLLAGRAATPDQAQELARELLVSGAAWAKFQEFIAAQGGDLAAVRNTQLLPRADHLLAVAAEADGYVSAVRADMIGQVSVELGAGRAVKDDIIDPAAGIVLQRKIGDRVREGEELATLHTNDLVAGEQAMAKISSAYTISPALKRPQPLIYGVID